MDDASLMLRFLRHGDQRAFAALVDRYLGLVYGVIFRRTGQRELSEELTQNVFAVLAKKAHQLNPNVVVSAGNSEACRPGALPIVVEAESRGGP